MEESIRVISGAPSFKLHTALAVLVASAALLRRVVSLKYLGHYPPA
jgi:hypothetical protein